MESIPKLSQEFIGPRNTVIHTSLKKLSVIPSSRDGMVLQFRPDPAAAEPNQFRPDFARKLSANLYDIYHCCVAEPNQFRPDPARKLSANLYDIYHCCVAEPNQFRPDFARKLSANLYDIYHCCVYSEKLLMMNRGTVRNT